jgi:hypothetical protein
MEPKRFDRNLLGRAPQGSEVQHHVVFVFNFGDYLRTIAPGTK